MALIRQQLEKDGWMSRQRKSKGKQFLNFFSSFCDSNLLRGKKIRDKKITRKVFT